MKPLIEVQPHIRAAHMYNYRGAPEEQRRRGYSYAFHLFTEGHGHMIVNEQVYPVASGSLIFVRPGEGHYFVPATGDTMDACNIYCDLWCLPQPKQPTFAYQWDDYDPRWLTEQMPCPELDGLPTSMSLRPYPHLIELIKQTLAAFNRSGKYTAQAVSACFYSWILQWHEAGSLTETADYRITRILEQMEACPEQRFSVEYWCSECGLEKSQFYRLFKQETGMSPKAYALQARMKKAAVLLMESRQSITDIALMLGYDSIHYFSNQFSSVYGISPSSYRMGKGYQKLDRWS